MAPAAFISGCSGPVLTADERAFFRQARPCGLILFARNCLDPAQVRSLTDAFRDCVGDASTLVLVDQEGGRVQRLRPPHWRAYPPAAAFGRLYAQARAEALGAAAMCAQLMGSELAALGINIDCAPVLDVPVEGAHDVIGDRAYGREPETVAALGRSVCQGLLAAGVLPVIKHVPGHGRARADSHVSLPVVEASADELMARDFRPFAALRDMPLAMTAHVLLPAFDAERPASVSAVIMERVIRGAIGFDGLVMSDDLGMGALSGGTADKAAAAVAAGVDVVLHCNGRLDEMTALADAAPRLAGAALRRYEAARARLERPRPLDLADAEAALARVSGLA